MGRCLQVVLQRIQLVGIRAASQRFAPSGLRLQNTLVRTKKQLGMADQI